MVTPIIYSVLIELGALRKVAAVQDLLWLQKGKT